VEQSTVAAYLPAMPYADVILGGSPCQSFSTAGKGLGDDDRNAWPDMIAAVAKVKPRMFLAENVPGMLNAKHLAYTQSVHRALERLGYVVVCKLLDAVDYGVPQFRNRLWWWGIRHDVYASGVVHSWPRPTHCWPPQPPGLFGESGLLPGVMVGQAIGLTQKRTLTQKCIDNTYSPFYDSEQPARLVDASPHGILDPKHPPAQPAQPAPTVQAKWLKGGAEGLVEVSEDGRTWESRHPIPDGDEPMTTIRPRSPRDGGRCTEQVIRTGKIVRRLTPDECARLQSCPDDMAWPKGITKTAKYRIVGNGWACGIAWALSQALAAADPESKTVIDLFAGGGLGALGWHGRYWSYQCLK
jgi:site-specific DNA-cytosine methylase